MAPFHEIKGSQQRTPNPWELPEHTHMPPVGIVWVGVDAVVALRCVGGQLLKRNKRRQRSDHSSVKRPCMRAVGRPWHVVGARREAYKKVRHTSNFLAT